MPITTKDVNVLHRYAEGVMNRADRHAGRVKGIALAPLGGYYLARRPRLHHHQAVWGWFRQHALGDGRREGLRPRL